MDPQDSQPLSPSQPKKTARFPGWAWVVIGAAAFAVIGLILLGLLATVVVPNVLQKYAAATRDKIEVDITAIESAMKEYAIANGSKYPDSLEALVTPDVNGHTYLDTNKVPKDPWGREYNYDAPGPGQPLPRIYSCGQDGRVGGEGVDADLDNLTVRAAPRGS